MFRSILLMVLISHFSFSPKTPKDFVWKNRILIIKSDEVPVGFSTEIHRLKMKDRKLLIFQFDNDQLIWSNFQGEIEIPHFLKKLTDKKEGHAKWALIGLDGCIKKTGEGMPKPEEIYLVIDAMPMRLSEINRASYVYL